MPFGELIIYIGEIWYILQTFVNLLTGQTIRKSLNNESNQESIEYSRNPLGFLFFSVVLITRLEESKQLFSEATFCSGGDNNPGLLVLTTETSVHHFAVNDSIVGRPSQGLIGKVQH